MATKPKKTAITKKTTSTTKSSGSDAVRKIQTDLNKKGANLKVDGISGKLTQAAQKKYGASVSNNLPPRNDTDYGVLSKKSGGSKSNSVAGYSSYADLKNSIKPYSNKSTNTKTKTGLFADLTKRITDAISPNSLKGSVPDANIFDGAYNRTSDYQVDPLGGKPEVDPNVKVQSPFQIIGGMVTGSNTGFKKPAETPIYNTPTTDNTALSAGQFSGTAPAPAPVQSGTNTGGTTVNKSTTTMADGTTITQTSPETQALGMTSPSGITPGGAGITNGLNSIITGLDGKIGGVKNDPFTSTATTSDNIVKYTDAATTQAANLFSSVEEFNTWSATPIGQKFLQDNAAKGITPEKIVAKIQPTVNGVVGAQTTPEYLASLDKSYASLEPQRKLLNEQMALEQGWTKEQKDILVGADGKGGMLATQKTEAQATIDALKIQIDNREQRIKDKLKLEIQKNNEELKVIDADLELQQLAAKSSMTGLLAKLGALDTSGAAMGALQNVDAKYDTEQARLRAKVAMANSELKLNAEIAIDDLEGQYDEKVLEINSDLSKSEREIRLDIMKLDYETKKDMLQVKMKWQDAIQTQKDKYEAASKKAAEDWTSEWFTTAGANLFKDMPKEFQLEWMNNNFFGKKPDGYKTPETQVGSQFLEYQKSHPAETKVTNVEITQMVNQQMGTAGWKSASKDEKIAYIRSLGGDPADFGL